MWKVGSVERSNLINKFKDNKMDKKITSIKDLIVDGLLTDGGHHKQWYLEKILEKLGFNVEQLRAEHGWDGGIAS